MRVNAADGRKRLTIVSFLTASLALPLAAKAEPTTLTETGSTLIYPLFQAWQAAYNAIDPNVKLLLAATGSGKGNDAAIAGAADIGTSDAYLDDHVAQIHPEILDIPLVISAQSVDVNLPDLLGGPLRLSGPVLAGIYAGRIRDWDAREIAALNPDVKLPHHAIVPVHRSDASGDSFVFTQFLCFSTPSWDNGPGYGTTIEWPSVQGDRTATGNDDMVRTIAATPYAVGYVGGSFADAAQKAGLAVAVLRNEDGQFVLPTIETIAAAADRLTPRTPPDERLTLAFAPGPRSYPLINYEYAVVHAGVEGRAQAGATASALRAFLLWCIDPQGGSASRLLSPLHFIALPPGIHALSETQIDRIH
jgi:phosphate transport system substrate-binding protein